MHNKVGEEKEARRSDKIRKRDTDLCCQVLSTESNSTEIWRRVLAPYMPRIQMRLLASPFSLTLCFSIFSQPVLILIALSTHPNHTTGPTHNPAPSSTYLHLPTHSLPACTIPHPPTSSPTLQHLPAPQPLTWPPGPHTQC